MATSQLFAASPSGSKYFSRMTNDGMLFFIMPQKVKALEGIKSFEYDVTLLTWNDSITLNFTYKSNTMDSPQDLYIKSGDYTYKSSKCDLLFVDIVKNGYEIRLSSKFLYSDFEKIVKNDIPPVFCFHQNGEQKSATFSHKAWKKERDILGKILTVYNHSLK